MQWAATTSVDFLLAQLIHQVIILLSTGGKNGGGYEASKYVVIAYHILLDIFILKLLFKFQFFLTYINFPLLLYY